MKYKINLFIDKSDYVKKISLDNIINVTGSVGSGKSTYGFKYRKNPKYIVLELDSLCNDNDPDTLNDEVKELREFLNKKYDNFSSMNINDYYCDIISFFEKSDKKVIIEGGCLADNSLISKLKGTIIVKRTARFKCYYRSAYRDFKNPAWRNNLNTIGLIKRFFHCFKRRFKCLFRQKQFENFIRQLDEL